MSDEDRYEAIELVLKSRNDGVSWFDHLFDLIAVDCEGGGGECITDDEEEDCDNHEHTELLPCTCGLENMGGMSGTLDQCYEWQTNMSAGISPLMVARVITSLFERRNEQSEDITKVVSWAYKEIEFEERWDEDHGEEAEEG